MKYALLMEMGKTNVLHSVSLSKFKEEGRTCSRRVCSETSYGLHSQREMAESDVG